VTTETLDDVEAPGGRPGQPHFSLNLGRGRDVQQVGLLQSASGGIVSASVIPERGQSFYVKKHLGSFKYEPIVIRGDWSLDRVLFDWVASAWEATAVPHDGAVVTSDGALDARSQIEFRDAQVSRFTIPAVDVASHDRGVFDCELTAQYLHRAPATGKVSQQRRRTWMLSDFRFEIDGLDTSRVRSVSGLTIDLNVPINFPDLRVGVAAGGGQAFLDWYESFVIEANNANDQEKTGRLRLLASDHTTELARVELFNVGIFRAEARVDRSVLADLYCERMELVVADLPTVAGTAPVPVATDLHVS